MKTNLLRFKVFAFFLALLLLTNCQEDEISVTSNQQSNVTQRMISLDDIQSMPGVMNALSKFKLQSTKENSISQKIIYNSKYDFIVDTDKVLLIQRGNYHSLSFPVYRDVDNGLQENLFLHPYNGGYLTFLMKYRFTPQQLDKISKGIALAPSEEVENMTFIPLDEEYTTNGGGYSGTVININGTCYTWHSVKDGWVACPGCECPTPLEVPSGGSNYGTFTLYSFSGFGDGGGTTGSPTGGPFNPTPPGSTIGTPPTVIPGVPYPTPGNDYGIITNPGHSIDNSDDAIIGFIQPTNAEYARFVNKLTIAQKDFWNNVNNLDKVIKITSFLQENGYTPENVAWIKQLINETIKTGLSFDIDKSFVSPFNIDMSAVSGTTPEEVKFNSIYNKVVTSPTFKQMFINVFGDNTKINAKFIIEEIPQTNNTTIYGLCQLQPYSSPNVLSNIIKIDKSHLLDTSDDVLAVAIIHECLHAFLNVKLRNPEIGMAILDINDMKFDECINTYYNGFTGNQNQHDFFVNHMTPTIKQILTEIKNTLYTPQQIYLTTHPELPNGVAIHSPMDNVIPLQPSEQVIPWNWDDYFTHLSFMGLQFCSSFNTIYPPNSVNLFYFTKYLVAGSVMFEP